MRWALGRFVWLDWPAQGVLCAQLVLTDAVVIAGSTLDFGPLFLLLLKTSRYLLVPVLSCRIGLGALSAIMRVLKVTRIRHLVGILLESLEALRPSVKVGLQIIHLIHESG